jgi:hypothetical protein
VALLNAKIASGLYICNLHEIGWPVTMSFRIREVLFPVSTSIGTLVQNSPIIGIHSDLAQVRSSILLTCNPMHTL